MGSCTSAALASSSASNVKTTFKYSLVPLVPTKATQLQGAHGPGPGEIPEIGCTPPSKGAGMVMTSFAADFPPPPPFNFLLSLQIVSGFADLPVEQHWRKRDKPFTLLCLHNSRGIDSSVYDTGTILVPWDFPGVPSPPQGYSRVSC